MADSGAGPRLFLTYLRSAGIAPSDSAASVQSRRRQTQTRGG